jgi:hypothetical protein
MTPGECGPFGDSERRIQPFGHLSNASLGLDHAQQSLPTVELHQWLGFLIIDFEAFSDRMLVVIGTLKEPMRSAALRTDLIRRTAASCRAYIEDASAIAAGTPPGDAAHKLGTINVHEYDGVERLPELRKHGIQGRRLFNVARKAIENESLLHIGRAETFGDDA